MQADSIDTLLTTADVVLDARFSPDGRRLAACGAEGTIRIFELATGDELRSIASHSEWVTAIAWSGDGAKLASSSRDKSAKAFDAETGELRITYSGHGELVSGVVFHPDGKQVYSAGADRKIHLWNLNDGKKAAEVTGLGGEVFHLASIGNLLFAASADKTARQFDATTRNQDRICSGHTDWDLSTAYHQETGRLATGSFDGSVRIWNTKDGTQPAEFVATPGPSPNRARVR